jgi:hypothetical protein
MNTDVIFTKNLSGNVDVVLGISNNTLLTTVRNLEQLENVDATNLSANNSLIYNTATAKWETILPSIANCADVSFSNLQSSNVLKWNSVTQRWNNRDLDYGLINIWGKLKDATVGSNVEFNLFDPANYDTFNITSNFSSGLSLTGNVITGLTNARNYKVESFISYNVDTLSASGDFSSIIKNATTAVSTISFTFNTGSKNYVITNSLASIALTGLQFFAKYPSAITGVAGTDININFEVLEI